MYSIYCMKYSLQIIYTPEALIKGKHLEAVRWMHLHIPLYWYTNSISLKHSCVHEYALLAFYL